MRGQVKQLIARLKKGEDFEKVAKKYSQDVGSAAKGGKLDDFSRGQLAPAFEQAAFALKPVSCPTSSKLPSASTSSASTKGCRRSASRSKPRGANQAAHSEHAPPEGVERLVATLRSKAKIETYL